jgi:phosphoesterase RecJ-like protein
MENNKFEEIWNVLSKAKRVLMSLHYGPDGDSLGACTGMKYLLERDFNCEVKLVSKDNLDSTLGELEYSEEVVFGEGIDEQNLEDFDVVLAMDSGAKKQFVGREKEFEFPEDLMLVVIDHHATNNYFGRLNYVDSGRPSACSVLLDMFRDRGVKFDSELATRLLLGIYTDSGYFSHDNGGALKDAAFLIDQGADYLDGIVNKVKYNFPLRVKQYYGLLYGRFKVSEVDGYKIGYSSVGNEEVEKLGLNLSEARGGPNELQEVGGIDVLFVLTDMGDKIKGSFRSRKGVDVSKLAGAMGGGGHKAAAAFFVDKMPLDKAEDFVLGKIRETGIEKI